MAENGAVLVIGESGLLGEALRAELRRCGQPFLSPPLHLVDLAREGELEAYFDEHRPSALINAAAFTDVARAEAAECLPEVKLLNVDVPRRMAKLCKRHGCSLLHVSTDYVFDGSKGEPYREDDAVAPLQVYGSSKLEGEKAVREIHPSSLVVRTSTLFGPGRRERPHYVDAVLRTARHRGELELVRLPVSSPTYTPDLALAMLRLLEAEATGVVHVVNGGACSRMAFALEAIRLAGLTESVKVSERAEPSGGPARPPYSVLDGTRYSELTGRTMRSWNGALAAYLGNPATDRLT
jgi:dTDP-4-dehydrorhamnose reductase